MEEAYVEELLPLSLAIMDTPFSITAAVSTSTMPNKTHYFHIPSRCSTSAAASTAQRTTTASSAAAGTSSSATPSSSETTQEPAAQTMFLALNQLSPSC